MGVRVVHDLDDLERDLRALPVTFAREAPLIVRRNVNEGNRLAVQFARERSGPHGKNYYKRLSGEMTGTTTGEFGPEGVPKSNFVGAGFRHEAPNMDLPDAADIIGPKLAHDVRSMLDEMFWP